MINTQELKKTVSKLPPDELLQFSEWFEEFMADQWDKKIEADILAGRLDADGKLADDEFITGRAKPLRIITLQHLNFGFITDNFPKTAVI